MEGPFVLRGTLREDGSIEVLGKAFSAPSYAALYAMQDAGTSRTTVNGWGAWKTTSGHYLADLRERYLASSHEELANGAE
jgi:hypothetical protein